MAQPEDVRTPVTAAELRARLERLREQHQQGLGGGLIMSVPGLRDAVFRQMGAEPGVEISWMTVRGDGLANLTPVPDHPSESEAAKGRLELMEIWASVLALGIGQGLYDLNIPRKRRPPLFEFARHVRNAVAHNGRFKIDDEVRPASWGTKEITDALHGTPLYDFMTPGDMVSFLDDVIAELHNW